MTYRYILFLILGLDALVLIFQTTQLSISYTEASLLYGEFSFLQMLIKSSLALFGQNDFALRFIMIMLHILSAILIYLISKKYLKSQRNRLWLLLMFVLLPGVVSSAIVVNSAGLVIFGLLLYIYLSEKTSQLFLNILLFIYALIDIGFVYLFLGLAIYNLYQKNKILFTYNISLYLLSSFIYGFGVYGSPSGHFLDTIAIYSAIFTPIIFIYLFYALYRRYLTNKVDMLWYISATALMISLLLSFRQRVSIEHFAPYLIIALPLAAQTFTSSYRVRLKMYRKKYRLAFILAFIFLILNTLVVFFNKDLYLFIDNPKKHFAYDMHIAKDLANNLKKMSIECINTNSNMQKRLLFYGIKKCDNYFLKEINLNSKEDYNVTISYKSKTIYKAHVTKINNK
jgi:hypothetical protein